MNTKISALTVSVTWLGAMAILAAVIAGTGRFGESLTAFLPRSGSTVQRALVQGLHTGEAAHILLLAIRGGTGSERAHVSRVLARELGRDTGEFSLVANGGQGMAQGLAAFVFAHRYQLAPRTSWTVRALRHDLRRDLAILESPAGLSAGRMLADPTGAFMAAARPWERVRGPRVRHGVWVSRHGRSALLLLKTRASGFAVGPQRRALERIRTGFAHAARGTALALTIGGTGAITVAANDKVADSAKVLTIIDLVLVTGILGFVYRSVPPLAASLVPLVTGALCATAITGLVFGRLAITTLGFGTMLIGVAMDYPTYVLLHVRPGEHVSRAARRVGRALGLAMAAMVMGFSTMMGSHLAGLVQLGVFAAIGLVAAAAAARYILPFMMPAWQPTADLGAWDARAARFSAGLRRMRAGVVVVALAAGGMLWARGPRVWDNHLSALSPASHALMRKTGRLSHAFGVPGLSSLVVVVAADREQALSRSAALQPVLAGLRHAGALGGYQMAAQYLPSRAVQRRRLQALPRSSVLRRRLRAAAAGLPFRRRAFRAFITAVARARHAPLLVPADVPAAVRARVDDLLMRVHGRGVAFVQVTDVRKARRVAQAIAASKVAGVHYVVVKRAVGRLLARYRAALLRHALIAGALMAVVIAIGLRSLREAARLVLPMAAAIVTACALLVATGPGLTLLNLVALLLIAGLCMGYALFLGDNGLVPERRGLAPWVCAAATITGFGVLASAPVAMLRSVGVTVSAGALLALIFTAAWSARRTPPVAGGPHG
ncbi:MMPL family transporter [Acidiferrobacter sp.]|uniref:MMPL family transporter n=1 Tax=Acidiferrobacter sp. TaxID=1872107 RepID=UPI0026368FA1|nr:MMPL family transporter [Acidiferrobacter sp.]